MKRSLFFALLALGVFSSCQKDIVEDLTTTPPPPTTPTNPGTATLNTSRSLITVGTFAGYTDTFTIQSNIDWSITMSSGVSSWLTLDTMKGGSGNTVVKLSISSNAINSQTGTLTVSPIGNTTISSQVITIKQEVYSLLWQKSFGASNSDGIEDVIEDTDGGYVFAGDQDKGWIFKTNANGNKLWEYSTSAMDYLNSVIIAPDGGYVATGRRINLDINGSLKDQDVVVVKLNASGAKVWEKAFGGSANDYGYKMLPAVDGGYIISGSTNSVNGDVSANYGGGDMWLLKIDVNGNKVWQKTYGGSNYESNAALTATADGGYLLTGGTESNDGDVSGNHGSRDVLVLKLDASGNKIWSKTFGGSDQEDANSIIATKDGGCIIAGDTYSNDGDVSGNHSSDVDWWVLKLDNNGQKTWQTTLGGTDMDQAYSIVASADGSYMVTGFAVSNNGDVTGNHGSWDYWVVKLGSTGKKLWQKTFGGPGRDWPTAIIATTDGSFVTAGSSNANGGDVTGISGNSKGWVVKFK
jgi:hypothetical protein